MSPELNEVRQALQHLTETCLESLAEQSEDERVRRVYSEKVSMAVEEVARATSVLPAR